MSDGSADRNRGIPSWQRVWTTDKASAPEQVKPTEQIRPAVLDASNESMAPETENSLKKDNETVTEKTHVKVPALATQRFTALNPPQSRAHPPPNNQQPPPISHRDIPPIITYPEFLIQSQKPPSFITAHRLLTTAYIASGVTAAMYGASKYLITPMLDILTSARHEFAENAQTRLKELNSRLSSAVSVDLNENPPLRALNVFKGSDAISEADTIDSDPTELFHRDYGTQTSLSLETTEATHSHSSSSSSADITTHMDPTDSQAASLHSIESLCTSMTDESESEGTSAQEIFTTIRVLNEYLESLTVPTYSFNNGGTFGGSGVSTMGGFSSAGEKGAKKEDDEITKIRTEIRGVKGVLLSAKNFPGGGRRALFPAAGTGMG